MSCGWQDEREKGEAGEGHGVGGAFDDGHGLMASVRPEAVDQQGSCASEARFERTLAELPSTPLASETGAITAHQGDDEEAKGEDVSFVSSKPVPAAERRFLLIVERLRLQGTSHPTSWRRSQAMLAFKLHCLGPLSLHFSLLLSSQSRHSPQQVQSKGALPAMEVRGRASRIREVPIRGVSGHAHRCSSSSCCSPAPVDLTTPPFSFLRRQKALSAQVMAKRDDEAL